MSKKSIDITAATFNREVLQSDVPVVMDFWAPWCGPCRRIGPALETLADSYDGKVKVIKVNVDDEPALAQRFGVRGIPALFALKQGEVVDQMVGFGGEKPLAAMFERLST